MVNTTWILVPAYNEAKSIGAVVADLAQHGWTNVLVVDDGSSDQTHIVAQLHGARVLKRRQNAGQGAALMAGIRHLLPLGPSCIVTFDADGQHQAADVTALVAPITTNQADIVLGSRFLNNSSVPFWRRLILKMGVLATRLLSRIDISDVHNGLRALGPRAFTSIRLTSPRMGHASEIMYQISHHQLRYLERPVTITYGAHHHSQPLRRSFGLGLHLLKLAIGL